MANIIEHGPTGLAAAAQVMGAGLGGMSEGIMQGQEYNRRRLLIQQERQRMQASQMELDLAKQQQSLRQQAAGIMDQYGGAAADMAQFQDTGETGVRGVKRMPMTMPEDLMQIYRQGDAETRRLIKDDWQMALDAANQQAIRGHVTQQANEILNNTGIYAVAEGDPSAPYTVPAMEAVKPQVEEILQEVEDGVLDPLQANQMLNQIQQGLRQQMRNGRTRSAVLGAFGRAIQNAYQFNMEGAQGLPYPDSQPKSPYAEYLQYWMEQYHDGALETQEAMAILKLQPEEFEAMLGMGARTNQGGGQGYTGRGVNIKGPGPDAEAAPVTTETEQYLETGETAQRMESRERALARRQRQAQTDEEARKAQVLTDSASSAESRMAGLDHTSRFGRALGMLARGGLRKDIVRKWVDVAQAGEVREGETQEQALERYNSLLKGLIGNDASADEVWVAQALAEDLQQVLAGPRQGDDLREILMEYGLSEREADNRVNQEVRKSPGARLTEDAATRLILNAKSYALRRGPMTQQQIVEQSEREKGYAEHDEIAARYSGKIRKVLRDDLTLEQAKKADRLLRSYDKMWKKVRADKDYRGGLSDEAMKIAKQLAEMGVPYREL